MTDTIADFDEKTGEPQTISGIAETITCYVYDFLDTKAVDTFEEHFDEEGFKRQLRHFLGRRLND